MSEAAVALPALRFAPLLRLAWRELWHERGLALCAACVLAATLAPLWTLWGLERGVIGALIARQDGDPLMRLIEPESTGQARFDDAWFTRVRAWPEVAFVMPSVRSAAALVELINDGAPAPITPELRATAAGDPLLAGLPAPSGRSLVLSAEAARKLAAAPGRTLTIPMERQRDGQKETAALEVTLAAVLPLAASDGIAALAPPPLLEAIEAWRDGYLVPALGPTGNGAPPQRTAHARFRLYATSIREVAAISARLENEGVSTRTRAREIEATLGLQRNLRGVLSLIGSAALAGAAIALVALQVATLKRKRRDHALLKLTGHGRGWLIALPGLQAVVVALVGAILALVLYGAAALAVNRYFATQLATGESAVRLNAVDMLAGAAAAIIVSLLPALWGGWRASTVEAADELREQ
ncbi:lipoprotein ABC transporter permease [Aquincola sp. S2]|uniref:Lipoprotein ABC transporter permease n=1 Tax=Pseudaquabacterium terrae TaxID=2732868 RepID=A0ABX2EEP1_9BURK|nr:lipoprotein ABC transporter permease [Aquabacterium terrae]NRF67072.1 lipoprotein ABC transporter permease [Aquabacterium terrae]